MDRGTLGDEELPELDDPDLRALAEVLRAQLAREPDAAWLAAAKKRLLERYGQLFEGEE